MSSKGTPVTLSDGRVIYVNIDDMEQLDMNPHVILDRVGELGEAKYCVGDCEVKEEADDGSYSGSPPNDLDADELSDFKMEVEDEEIDSLAKQVLEKIKTCACNVKEEEEPSTSKPPEVEQSTVISSGDEDEFRGFRYPTAAGMDTDVDSLSNLVQEQLQSGELPSANHRISIQKHQEPVVTTGKAPQPCILLLKPEALPQGRADSPVNRSFTPPQVSPDSGANRSYTPPLKVTSTKTPSPEPSRKTTATSPFKEIETSFGSNPLILQDDDESTEPSLPQIISSTSLYPHYKPTPSSSSDEMMIIDDDSPHSSNATVPPVPGLVPIPQLKRPKLKGANPAPKIVRLHEACCLIDKLNKRKFTSDAWWSEKDREQIVIDGRPSVNYETFFGFSLNTEMLTSIQKLKWLTGCVHRKKLCCWICLLFCDYGAAWVFNPKRGMDPLLEAFKMHSNSQVHKQAEVREKKWIKLNSNDKYKSKQNVGIRDSPISSGPSDEHEESPKKIGNTMPSQVHSYAATGIKPNNDHQKPCLIRMLLNNNFIIGSWKDGEQDEIVTQGRRCPSMEYLFSGMFSGYEDTIFTDDLYVKYPWLTGSWERKKLYCWPCLLYNSENSCLKFRGSSPAMVFEEHEILNSHLESSLCLKLLEHDIKMRSTAGKVEQDQETVKKKREFLKHLIDVVCITKTNLKNSGPSEEDYAELLKLIASYNINLEGFLSETSTATGKDAATYLVSNHAEGILTAIAHVMMKQIEKEVQNSPFISIMLDDVKGLINKSFVSVIIRYVEKNGQVHERFIKFIEVGYSRTSSNMIREVMSVVNELGCESRVVGFSYDGAVIEPTDVRKFNAEMSATCTSALFFHNRNHNLKFLIQQALSHLKECRHFFQHLVPLMDFFTSTPAAINELIELDSTTVDDSNARVWDFSFGFVHTIHRHYAAMLTLLDNITKKPNDWDIEHVVQAPYFMGFLRNYQNRFFIVFLSEVLSAVDDLAEVLDKDFDVESWKKSLNEATTKLRQMRPKINDICRTASNNSLSEVDRTIHMDQAVTLYESNKELYDNLLTYTINFITARIEGAENFKFFDSDVISGIVDKSRDGSNDIIARLTTTYSPVFSPLFNIPKLKAQLEFHFGHKCFKPIKSINELMKDMHEYEMSGTMAELYRLMRLILTIPVASNFIDKTTTYEKMASYVKTNIHNLSTVNALMWTEKELLESLQEEENFYEWVIAHFTKGPGRGQFRLHTTTKNK